MGHALFGLIWSKNAKVSVHAKIWYLDYFKYIKFDCEVQFFYFRYSFANFVQKNSFGILMLPDSSSSSLPAKT